MRKLRTSLGIMFITAFVLLIAHNTGFMTSILGYVPAGSETIRVFEDVDTWDEKIIGNGRQRAKIDPRIAGKIDVTSDDWEKPYVPDKQEDPLGIFSNPKLPQDDPVLVEYIRQRVLLPPSKMDYNLQRPEIRDPSEEEATTKFMMSLLDSNLVRRGRNGESKNDTGQRVFFEAGALDGEIASRTLFLERFKGWTGLTVEMTLPNIIRYLAKHRKAWFAPVCLSPEPRPVKKQMRFAYDPKDPWLERTGTINKHKFDVADKRVLSSRLYIYTVVDCFPLYSLLLAANMTRVHFLNLDLEGVELQVLQTVPFDKVDFQVVVVETAHTEEGVKPLREFMTSKNFKEIHADEVSKELNWDLSKRQNRDYFRIHQIFIRK